MFLRKSIGATARDLTRTSRDQLRRRLAWHEDGVGIAGKTRVWIRRRHWQTAFISGQTHIFEQGSNVGCHQQYSCALRCCQLPCHNALSQVGRGLAQRTLEVRSGINKQNRSRRISHEAGYKAGNLPLKPGLRRLGWSIFFSSGRASTRSCFAVEGPLAAAVGVLLLVLLFHVESHRKSFRFNPRRPPEGSGSFQRRVFAQLLCGVKVSLRKQDSLPGPLPSLFGADWLESFTALTSPCQWKHGAVLKGQRTVNTTSLAQTARGPLSDTAGLHDGECWVQFVHLCTTTATSICF